MANEDLLKEDKNLLNKDENQLNQSQNAENDKEKEGNKIFLDANEGAVTEKSSENEVKTEEKPFTNKKRTFGSMLGFDEIFRVFKRSKEQNKNVKKYAILGIIFSVLSVALVYPCFYGGLGLFNFIINSFFGSLSSAVSGNIVLIFLIGLIVSVVLGTIAIALFVLPVGLAIFSLILPIFQLIMNKKWWAWLALAFGISAIPLCIFIFMQLIQAL